MIRWLRPLVALFVVIAASTLAKALELRTASSSSLDLAIKGGLAGVPKGEVRYLRWSDLATLPTSKIRITGEFVPGEQEVTVVFLSDLMKALPLQPTVDAALATCTDGFATIFKTSFIGHYRPFLVIEIAGRPPSAWPPPGVTYNPGPYAITVSERLAPDARAYLDIEHKLRGLLQERLLGLVLESLRAGAGRPRDLDELLPVLSCRSRGHLLRHEVGPSLCGGEGVCAHRPCLFQALRAQSPGRGDVRANGRAPALHGRSTRPAHRLHRVRRFRSLVAERGAAAVPAVAPSRGKALAQEIAGKGD